MEDQKMEWSTAAEYEKKSHVTALPLYGSYEEYKSGLDQELKRAAESFVRVGYLIKIARDTDILKDSPYENYLDFAYQEYGLDKSMVSRFIRINSRFSEGGNTDHLLPEYEGYGYAKLSLMLQLPDEVVEELSPAFSKSEIQTLKEEFDEEQKTSDLEILMQQRLEATKEQTLLEKAVYEMLKTDPELYGQIWTILNDKYQAAEIKTGIYEAVAPYGESIHTVLIQGTGRVMLSVKGIEVPVTMTVMRSGEKESSSFVELVEALDQLMVRTGENMDFAKSYETVFSEKYPEAESRKESKVTKAKVAPVQPKAEQVKLHDIDSQIPEPDPKEEETELEIPAGQQASGEPQDNPEEEQIPGQDEVTNHPEYLPDDQVETIPPENVINPKCEGDFVKLTEDGKIRIWNDAADAHNHLDQFFEQWSNEANVPEDALNRAYCEAVNLAAGLERLLIDAKRSGIEGKEEHG